MATAAKIQIQLEAQTAQLRKGFGEATGAIRKMDRGMSGAVASGMAKFHIALAAIQGVLATARGAINKMTAAMSEMDATQKMADRIGMSADALTALHHAAGQTGASTDVLDRSLEKMTRRVAEAAKGTGQAKDALAELGLSADTLKSMSPEDQFGLIADAMANVSDQSDKTRLAMDIMGRSGGELMNMFNQGSEGLNAYAQEANELGMMLGSNRKQVEEANDAIDEMNKAWGALVQKLVIALTPAIEAAAQAITSMAQAVHWLFGLSADTAIEIDGLSKSEQQAAKGAQAATKAAKEHEAAMKKEMDAAKAAQEALMSRGESITQSLRTPGEIFKDTLDELADLVQQGALSWDVYQRGVAKAAGTLRDASKANKDFSTSGIGAVTRASAAGFSATQAAERQRRDAERRHNEQVEWLAKVERAIRETELSVTGVGL